MKTKAMFTVGILTRRPPDEQGRPFGPPTGFFEECCEAAATLDLRAVVFDAADVDAAQGTVSPATVVDGRWVECGPEPWPEFIYDRAPVLDPAEAPAADRARGLFDRAGIPFVNPASFVRLAVDKLEMHRRLADAGLAVPHTEILEAHALRAFLARYDHVYIKPRAGSLGTGVMEIVRSAGGRQVIRTLDATYETQGTGQSMDRIMALTAGARGEPMGCLVQQGISAEPAGERRFPRFDLRLLMQKNGQARWDLTGLAARVAQNSGPTTNLSNGARSEEAEPVLDGLYGRPLRKEVLRRAEEASFAACRLLDTELGPIGEVGLDIVPDESGLPWIIEINARPGRNVFRRIARSADVPATARQRYGAIRRRSVARPFEYARVLAGIGATA
ncbi:MAG: YheC/YheD family protein [candidate division Zixibacteria bacterium]|nr:YheC/YheD family protein [candidate division Zixibacteria bacterium]